MIWVVSLGPPTSNTRKWRPFRRSQPHKDGEVQSDSKYDVIPLGPPAGFESGDSFTDRSPPGMARSNLSPRRASLRWPPQQPSKVATVSQIAAPQGWRGLV